MGFDFKKCFDDQKNEFNGLYEIQPVIFGDSRGNFLETYSEKDFFDAGLTMKFVQDDQSTSVKGVLRGLHFQTRNPQGKLVRSLFGQVYDVAVDLRKNSATFGKYYGMILDCEKANMIYIPEGFAHGFYAMTDLAVIAYKCTNFYDPKGEGGLMWNDPVINIDWKSACGQINPLLSEKDKKYPAFDFKNNYYNINGKWEGNN